ncbi:glycerophosphoryl diester phosphodiesterase [Virgisporangium aliadipatigenens]|uniref:Glycerophosphoryl diester phosphodiesterase n=1 Tax=Virgisporangium aliadipatigenens TaxID=741659 RepID=A0A8J3YKF3_9ACTN|nr:glycerophosphodiester phosphodiesterase [Virgisporangium aliadipatigenens]GIJ45605.1 glycerophosphoryl diester phosphodiesterase [Virgisporangium aliadipatigenens]
MHPYLDAPRPIAFAHRGGAAVGDENTPAAFARAISAGYRYVETDVHATSDGVVVVFHDKTLHRMLGRPGRVRDVSWADLRSVRDGGATVVPRLDEVLEEWPNVRFNIDVKADPAVGPTVDLVRRAGVEKRVLLASFSDRRLARIRKEFGPELATSMGKREVARLWLAARLRRPPRIPAGVVAAQVPWRQGRITVVDEAFVSMAHRLGLQVHVWTIDDPRAMHHLLDLGVDGIMTDRIEILREVYTARGAWFS